MPSSCFSAFLQGCGAVVRDLSALIRDSCSAADVISQLVVLLLLTGCLYASGVFEIA